LTEELSDKIIQLIHKYGLANAIKYDGKADAGAVIGKLFAERPDLRQQAQKIIIFVKRIVQQVNKLSQEEQIAELKMIAPELLVQHREHVAKELPPLEGVEKGKVTTRLPPEPSGYPHIGHAYAGYINWYYARKYNGRLVLRFEDTNPRNVKREYYDAFREGYRWMNIDWDHELKVSDDVPYFYERARKLLERGEAYLCTCPIDTIKNNRRNHISCAHREVEKETNLVIWDDILDGKYREGEIVCRLKIDMNHANAVMRDPNIFRIIEYPHPFQGDKYRLWPTYDFAVAFEDHLNGITHILRSSEFSSRGELQAYIRSRFNLPQPRIQEFSRFSIEGTPVSKRKIRPLIESGKISGWDDIRLSTITALCHRGIIPETIREITREVGMSVAQPVIDWSLILGINRRLIDPMANRYYYVNQPVRVRIKDTKPTKAVIPLHPDFTERGTRIINVQNHVYIDGNDAAQLKRGTIFRLKHLYNVQVKRKTAKELEGVYAGNELEQASMKIQWTTDEKVPVQLRIPDVLFRKNKLNPKSLHIETGVGERALQKLAKGTIIQLERKGFGYIEYAGDNVIINMTS